MKQQVINKTDNEDVRENIDCTSKENELLDAVDEEDLISDALDEKDETKIESSIESEQSEAECLQENGSIVELRRNDNIDSAECNDQNEKEVSQQMCVDENTEQIEEIGSDLVTDANTELNNESEMFKKETEEDSASSDGKNEQEKTKGKKKRLFKVFITIIALLCLAALAVFVIVPSTLYSTGQKALANKEYDKAQDVFIKLKTYRDSEELVKECDYQKADSYMQNEDFEDAILIWQELDGYKDSKERTANAETAIKDRTVETVLSVDETFAKHGIETIDLILHDYAIDSEAQSDQISAKVTGNTDVFRYSVEYDLLFVRNEEGTWVLQDSKKLSDIFEPLVTPTEAAEEYLRETYPEDEFEWVEEECYSSDLAEIQVFTCVKREHLTYQTQYSVEVQCVFDEEKGNWRILADDWWNVLDIDDEKKTYKFYGFNVVVPEWWTADIRVVGEWTPMNDLPDDYPEADFYADGKLVLSLHPTLIDTYSDSAFNDLLNRLQPDGVTLRPYTIYKDAGRIVFCPYGFDSFETIETNGLTTEEVKYIAEKLKQ